MAIHTDSPPVTDSLHVYAGTAGHSAWFSEDGGASWVHPNSHSGLYLEARVWSFASHPARPDRLFAGTDMGIYRWDEAPARWTALASPMQDVWAVAIDPADPDFLIAGTRPAGLYRSTDAGATWAPLAVPGIAAFSEVNRGPTRVTQILFDPLRADCVWAAIEIGGIFRSDDRGASWRACDAGLISRDVHGIASVRGADGAPLLFATTNRGLHRSEDGAHWVLQALDSPWQYTRAVVPHPADPATLFVTNGNGPPGSDGRLLRSRDHGRTFAPVALPGPLNSTVWCVAADPAVPQVLFAATNLGQLFRSDDGGQRWQRLAREFGEIRALHWRRLPAGVRQGEHSLTLRPAAAAAGTAATGTAATGAAAAGAPA
ncbi:MAG: WD40/YVTN/BNR-like repeat-containing protein [Lautropia sp.]